MKKSLLILIVSLFLTSAAWAQRSLPMDVLDAAQRGDQEAQLEKIGRASWRGRV